MSQAIKHCPACRRSFDPMVGGYSPDGIVVCAACAEALRLKVQEWERKKKIHGAIGSALMGLGSFIQQTPIIMIALPLLAVTLGIHAAWTSTYDSKAPAQLGWKRVPVIALGLAGAALGFLSLVVRTMPFL